jgi:hypothetical protein
MPSASTAQCRRGGGKENGAGARVRPEPEGSAAGSIALRAAKAELDAAEYQQQATTLDQKLTRHLRNRILRDDDNQRLLNGVGTQQDRGNLLRFLHEDAIEPTNNWAERELAILF